MASTQNGTKNSFHRVVSALRSAVTAGKRRLFRNCSSCFSSSSVFRLGRKCFWGELRIFPAKGEACTDFRFPSFMLFRKIDSLRTQHRNGNKENIFNVCCKSFCFSFSMAKSRSFQLLAFFPSRRSDDCPKTERLPFGFQVFFSILGKRKHDSTCFFLLPHTAEAGDIMFGFLCSKEEGACSHFAMLLSLLHMTCADADVVIVNGMREVGRTGRLTVCSKVNKMNRVPLWMNAKPPASGERRAAEDKHWSHRAERGFFAQLLPILCSRPHAYSNGFADNAVRIAPCRERELF